ncbi:hypothetical protein [Streptomyces odontomachi]|uniref:hypothetical protein n=1 Tax=Streptomyces odontomachi TaxID=2944940 RepID=UPI00210A8B5B|nr:hypothetical protein [Streptomyces sp. ODS25]
MRHLPVRPLVTGAVCAALALGGAAPVVAADQSPSRDGAQAPAAPSAAALLGQAAMLHQTADVLTPVSQLLDAVLKADNHQLAPSEAQKYTDAVHKAVTTAKAPAASGATHTATTLPDYREPAGAHSSARDHQARQGQSAHRQQAARDTAAPAAPQASAELRTQALTRLQTAADALARSSTAGDRAAVDRQIPVVVSEAVNFVTATLAAGDLPSPSMQGLPRVSAPSAAHPQPHADQKRPQRPQQQHQRQQATQAHPQAQDQSRQQHPQAQDQSHQQRPNATERQQRPNADQQQRPDRPQAHPQAQGQSLSQGRPQHPQAQHPQAQREHPQAAQHPQSRQQDAREPQAQREQQHAQNSPARQQSPHAQGQAQGQDQAKAPSQSRSQAEPQSRSQAEPQSRSQAQPQD